MSKIVYETEVYGDSVKAGDVFVLEDTSAAVKSTCQVPGSDPIEVDMIWKNTWRKDEALSKVARAEHKKNMDDWQGL